MKKFYMVLFAILFPAALLWGSQALIQSGDTVYTALYTKANANFTELYNSINGTSAPTLKTPLIADFSNATHNHSSAAQGGNSLSSPYITSPVMSGSASGTYTIGGTFTVTQPSHSAASFQNSWGNSGAPYTNVEYVKDTNGFCHIRGCAHNGSANTNTIFTLPSGSRPVLTGSGTKLYFPNRQNSSQYINFNNDGTIASAGSVNDVCFDGIVFQCN